LIRIEPNELAIRADSFVQLVCILELSSVTATEILAIRNRQVIGSSPIVGSILFLVTCKKPGAPKMVQSGHTWDTTPSKNRKSKFRPRPSGLKIKTAVCETAVTLKVVFLTLSGGGIAPFDPGLQCVHRRDRLRRKPLDIRHRE
jgi:hypothetical protein